MGIKHAQPAYTLQWMQPTQHTCAYVRKPYGSLPLAFFCLALLLLLLLLLLLQVHHV
jgi:hypothetical protein